MRHVTAALLVLLLAACGFGSTADEPSGGGSTAPAETAAETLATPEDPPVALDEPSAVVLVDGLRGPTQIAAHPDGRLLVAEVGDGEGTPTGTVTAISLDDPADREVLLTGLNTPTGVTAADGRLWVMEPTRLLVAPLQGGQATVVFDEMPNNGRSNGTITTLSDGRLVFDTAGRRRGFDPAPGSGTLWALTPAAVAADGSVEGLGPDTFGQPILTGMKHAYAVAQLPDDRLAVTEMSDGRYDGEPAPDEVHVIDPTIDGLTGGWPRCVGDQVPVVEFDGTDALCEQTIESLALFPASATPTGVAVQPDPGTPAAQLLVTQWTRGQVVRVPAVRAGQPAEPEVVIEGLQNPQHLLVRDGQVLLSVFGEGTIVRVEGLGG